MSYEVVVRRTDFRVAHIEAGDFGSLGFGEGNAQAEDNADIIARLVLRNRGELSRWFGPGERDGHVLSDVGFRALEPVPAAEGALASQTADVTAWVRGFADGFNHWCAEHAERTPEWYPRLASADVHAAQWADVCVSGAYARMIALAQPPGAGGAGRADVDPVERPDDRQNGSNAIALGSELTSTGRGMLLVNPHFLWYGPGRWWEKHLVIPGRLNVYGVNFVGCPGVAFGFNEHVGWSHTRAYSSDTVLYRIGFTEPGAKRYRFGETARTLEPRRIDVPVRQPGGEVTTVTRETWHSHHGPLLSHPQMPWTDTEAVALRDVCRDADRIVEQWLAFALADSVDRIAEVAGAIAPLGVLHTTATGADGRVFYRDTSGTAHLSNDALAYWRRRLESDALTQALDKQAIVLLDGNDPAHALVEDAGASVPGCVPAERCPTYRGRDYAFNANDSHWLVNVRDPVEDAPRTFGRERTERSLRTRMIARYLESFRSRPAATTLEDLKARALDNRSLAADLVLADLLEAARGRRVVSLEGEEIALDRAIRALEAYGGRLDLDARGAVLFREWLDRYIPEGGVQGGLLLRTDRLFAAPFDPADPVGTPCGLAHRDSLALENLAQAVRTLDAAGIALDARLAEVQRAYGGAPASPIPVHGGQHWEGVSNAIYTVPDPDAPSPFEKVEGSMELTTGGYPVNAGASFVMAVEFTAEGPRAEGFLLYGQTADPSDPASHEQIERFARKAWRPMHFRAADVDGATVTTQVLRGT